MDAFEQVVAMLLRRRGYWVETSYKIKLTPSDKKRIGLPSCPRWEIDIVAYRPVTNTVLAVECKSFLDSPGVSHASFSGQNAKGARRYKLFTQPKIREVVLARLAKQLCEEELARDNPQVQLCLAAGKIRKGEEELIKAHCANNKWGLFASEWFAEQFKELAQCDYENDVATVAAKIAARSLS